MLSLKTQEGQTEQIHPQTIDDPFFDSTGMIYIHWAPTGQTVNKEYYVVVLREFLSLPIVQRLLPVTFGSSLSSEAVVMRQLRR